MHPTLLHEIARYSQADLLRNAERERPGHEVTMAPNEPQRRDRLRSRSKGAVLGRPVFSR